VNLEDFPDFDQTVGARLDRAVDGLAAEFDGIFERDRIADLVAESARQLSNGTVAAFVPVLAQRFARERLRARAQAEGRLARTAPEVLFVSLTGGGRALIGAALLSRCAGDAVTVHSAGSHAEGGVDPNVSAAMRELEIDLSEAFTKPLTPEVLGGADVVVTMGRSVGAIEIPPTTRHVDWRVGDPAGATLDEVRRVREDIDRRVASLALELAAGTAHG
jgi:arsenate reductase (thioredoxin)